MADPVTISMVMIAKNEAKNIRPCFETFWEHVDEVVLVDTGSTDLTIWEAEEFAELAGEPDKLKIGRFEWCDDFAAARNYANTLATGNWLSWTDLDDRITGAEHLRGAAIEAPDHVTTLYAIYDYAKDEDGHVFCELWRERLCRAGATEWIGAIHECQVGPGNLIRLDPDRIRWIHERDHGVARDRNERILRTWLEREPDNPRVVGYLAYELMGSRREVEQNGETLLLPDMAKIQESLTYFERYMELPGQSPELRAQNVRRYAQALATLDRQQDILPWTLQMLVEAPSWADSYLTLAELAHNNGDYAATIEWSQTALAKGAPDTVLIINPEDYTLRPRVMIASALAATNKLEDAVRIAEEVAQYNPRYMNISVQLAEWRGILAREETANLWVNAAKLLYENDEPEKAHAVLQTVPFFVGDHPAVVGLRGVIFEALKEPYQVVPVGDEPRGRFLVRSLNELLAEQDEIRESAAEAAGVAA